jgi:hypothetical protein
LEEEEEEEEEASLLWRVYAKHCLAYSVLEGRSLTATDLF